jgi:hypothetical protein
MSRSELCVLCSVCPQVFAAAVQCKTSALGDEQRRMLKFIQRFGEHCSCLLQGDYVCPEDDNCIVAAASNVESYTFRQTLQLAFSGKLCLP